MNQGEKPSAELAIASKTDDKRRAAALAHGLDVVDHKITSLNK
jgi:hypothetical protein